MKILKTTIVILIFIALAVSAISLTLTTFSNTLSEENISLTAGTPTYRYFALRTDSNVTSAYIDLIGYASNSIQRSTGATGDGGHVYGGAWENFSFVSNTTLNQIGLYLSFSSGYPSTVEILNSACGSIASTTNQSGATSGTGWSYYHFNPAVSLVENTEYFVKISGVSAGTQYLMRTGNDDTTGTWHFYGCDNQPQDKEITLRFITDVYPTNLTIDTGNDTSIDYQNDTLWDGTSASENNVDINSTAIYNFLTNNCSGVTPPDTCNVTITFESATLGTIEVSNINITYSLPTLDINSNQTYPATPIYASNITLNINVTSSAGYDVSFCNFTLTNPSSSNVIDNINGTQSGDLWNSTAYYINATTANLGTWNWNVSCEDNVTTSATLSESFSISDTTNPTITINVPATGYSSGNSTIEINLTTADDVEVNNCWYKLINYTNGALIVGNTSIFCALDNESFPIGTFNMTAYVNDTSGNINSTTNTNITITTDTSPPTITLTQPSGAKTSRSITITYNITDNKDPTSSLTCGYWITLGASVHIANTTINCSQSSDSTLVSTDGSFVIHLWARDLSSNTATETSSFTVGTTEYPSAGGGGGTSTQTYTSYIGNWSLSPDSIYKFVLFFPTKSKQEKTFIDNVFSNKPIDKCKSSLPEIICYPDPTDSNNLIIETKIINTNKLIYNIKDELTITSTDNEAVSYEIFYQAFNLNYAIPIKSIAKSNIPVVSIPPSDNHSGGLSALFLFVLIMAVLIIYWTANPNK